MFNDLIVQSSTFYQPSLNVDQKFTPDFETVSEAGTKPEGKVGRSYGFSPFKEGLHILCVESTLKGYHPQFSA